MVHEYEKPNGVFWFPDFPEKIDGYYFIPKNGELKVLLIDDKNVLKKRFKDNKDVIFKDVILGERKNWIYFGRELPQEDEPSKLTLIKNSITRKKDYPKVYEVAPYLVIDGAHFNSLEEITFNELSMKYDYLADWIGSRQNVETEIEDATVSLVFDGKEAYFKVKFNSEKSLKECLEIEEDIGQFLSFVSACDFGLLEFKGKSSKGEAYIIKQFTVGYLPRTDFIFTLKDIQNDFGKFLSKWIELRRESKRKDEPSKIEIITNVLISMNSYHNEVEKVYTDFLICVSALETYHSTKFETSIFKKNEKNEWDSIKSELKEIVDKHKHSFSEEGIVNSLKYKIEYELERKSLRRKLREDILENFLGTKIREILFEKDVKKKVKKAIKSFVSETVDYRNKLVHSLDLPSIKDLTKLIPKLKAILKACILKDLGFSDELIIQGVEEYLEMQKQQYQIYEVSLNS